MSLKGQLFPQPIAGLLPDVVPITYTSYTVQARDNGKLLSISASASGATIHLPVATTAGFYPFVIDVQNLGTLSATITPTTSTINGAASFTLTPNSGIRIFSDGANYYTMGGAVATGGVKGTAVWKVVAGAISNLVVTGVISGVTRTAAGTFTINLSPSQINWVVSGTASDDNVQATFFEIKATPDYTIATSSFQVEVFGWNGSVFGTRDAGYNSIIIC